MTYTIVFGLVALVSAGLAVAGSWWGGWAAVLVPGAFWMALAFGGASLAYAGLGPSLFGKRPDGRLPVWSYALFGPFLIFGRAGLRAANATGIGESWNEVSEGVWLGRRPHPTDRDAFAALGVVAVLDMAAEVARSRLMGAEAYLTLPVLDHAGPRPEQLTAAMSFLDVHRSRGPVYVHCALGIGRGATVIVAWLLHSGQVESVAAGERELLRRRRVLLSDAQRRALEAWWTAA